MERSDVTGHWEGKAKTERLKFNIWDIGETGYRREG